MVITYLEMTARPALRTAPAPDGCRLAPWPKPPLEDYREIMRRVGTDWLWHGRLSLSDGELKRQTHSEAVDIECIWQGDTPVAISELKFKTSEAELVFFGVAPSLIGTTAARFLMAATLERAWQRPINWLYLDTCTLDSPKALDFYRRSGFVEYDRAIRVSPDPRLNGILPHDAASNIAVLE